jgi:hypothetical protein
MLIEIINTASDVYSYLYSFRTLAALYRAEPNLSDKYANILPSVILKALNFGN